MTANDRPFLRRTKITFDSNSRRTRAKSLSKPDLRFYWWLASCWLWFLRRQTLACLCQGDLNRWKSSMTGCNSFAMLLSWFSKIKIWDQDQDQDQRSSKTINMMTGTLLSAHPPKAKYRMKFSARKMTMMVMKRNLRLRMVRMITLMPIIIMTIIMMMTWQWWRWWQESAHHRLKKDRMTPPSEKISLLLLGGDNKNQRWQGGATHPWPNIEWHPRQKRYHDDDSQDHVEEEEKDNNEEKCIILIIMIIQIMPIIAMMTMISAMMTGVRTHPPLAKYRKTPMSEKILWWWVGIG